KTELRLHQHIAGSIVEAIERVPSDLKYPRRIAVWLGSFHRAPPVGNFVVGRKYFRSRRIDKCYLVSPVSSKIALARGVRPIIRNRLNDNLPSIADNACFIIIID